MGARPVSKAGPSAPASKASPSAPTSKAQPKRAAAAAPSSTKPSSTIPEGFTRVEQPSSPVPTRKEIPAGFTPDAAPASPVPAETSAENPWRRIQSRSSPGTFYYFNELTGESRTHTEPPPPWEFRESRSRPGVFYYLNMATMEQSVDPPDM